MTNVDEATDGGGALAKLREKAYGLIISDWNMEPMTGLELLKEVRADEKMKGTPFIMVTAESKTDNVIAAKKAGVNNYIVKPFNADTLKKKMSAVIRVRTHYSHQMTAAARAIAAMKFVMLRSKRVAIRRQSLRRQNMRSMMLRCL